MGMQKLLAVRIDTLKALAYTSIVFRRKQREERDGLLQWVVNWAPNEHSWICSVHFVSGFKSNDPLSPDYVPSVFCCTKSPEKRKLASDMERYERKVEAKKRRVENCDRLAAASSLLALSGIKSNDPLSPDYVPSVFCYTKSPVKRKLASDMERYEGKVEPKKRIVENYDRLVAASSLLALSGIKSNDPLSPNYVPSVFCYTKNPVKRKLASDMQRYERKVEAKKRRVENCDRLAAASSLLALSGIKSNDPLSPNYVPSVFCYTKSPVKRKLASDMERYERKVEAKKRIVENCDRLAAASSLLALSGIKSNDPLSPNYVPSVFCYTKNPVKRKLASDMQRYERKVEAKKRRVEKL